MVYSLDTSALIGAWWEFYPRDVFPTVWDRFDELVDEGRLICPDEVYHELRRKDDELFAWAKEREASLFMAPDAITQQHVRSILDSFNLVDVNRNRSAADPWVIALALARGGVVITLSR